jgi:hypothetical protein
MNKDLLTLLKEPLSRGCVFSLETEGDFFVVGLNTEAKSECILKCKEDGIYAHRRYDRVDKVDSYEHLLELIYECRHGRSFFSKEWFSILKDHGYKFPTGWL